MMGFRAIKLTPVNTEKEEIRCEKCEEGCRYCDNDRKSCTECE